MKAPGWPSPRTSRRATSAAIATVTACASPSRSHPSEVVPSDQVTTASLEQPMADVITACFARLRGMLSPDPARVS